MTYLIDRNKNLTLDIFRSSGVDVSGPPREQALGARQEP
jgi:hypothetical protein